MKKIQFAHLKKISAATQSCDLLFGCLNQADLLVGITFICLF